MITTNINKVSAKGNNIFVFQYIDEQGNTSEKETSLQEFLQPFIKEYKERIEELKASLRDKDKIIDFSDNEALRKSQEIADLKDKIASKEKQAKHLLQELEGKDLRQLPKLYQEATYYFMQGKLQKALNVLDEAKIQEAEKVALENIKNIAKTRMLKAQLLRIANRFKEAGENYEKALTLIFDWDNCFEVANYFAFLNEFTKAEKYYNLCLIHANNKEKKAIILNNLANLHSDKNKIEKAEQEYNKALQIYRELAIANTKTYLPAVATTLNNLANLHRTINEYQKAEQEYNEALQIRKELAKTNSQIYLPAVATTLNNLANLHSDKNKIEKAEQEYNKALGIRRELAKTNPQTYLPDLAITLNNLASLHSNKKEFEKAEQEYNEALQIKRELAKANPQTYLPNVAITLINMSIFYKKAKVNKELSIELVDKAITILLPFANIPYIQNYLKGALAILKNWGIDTEKYLKQKLNHANSVETQCSVSPNSPK